jgi:hypothetical protein
MRNRTTDQILTAIRTLKAPLEPDASEQVILMRRREREDIARIERAITDIVDTLSIGEDALARTVMVHEIVGTHRYLQQELIVTLLQTLGDLGTLYQNSNSGYADARNEFAMKLCVKLRACFADELFF